MVLSFHMMSDIYTAYDPQPRIAILREKNIMPILGILLVDAFRDKNLIFAPLLCSTLTGIFHW